MILKGVMTIELTDEATGAVETVTEENMITNAVNDILGCNPMGFFIMLRMNMTPAWSGTRKCCPYAPT